MRAPSAEEVRAGLAAAETRDRRLWLFIRVTAASGARRGEVCGIRWSDIDWTEVSIRLDEAVIAAPGGGILKQPKTRTSVRTIAVDADHKLSAHRHGELLESLERRSGPAALHPCDRGLGGPQLLRQLSLGQAGLDAEAIHHGPEAIARLDGRFQRLKTSWARIDVVVIDDFLLRPLTADPPTPSK